MRFQDNDSVSQILALPVTNFVQAAYKKLLDRLPDPLELKSNTGAIRCGLGRINFLAVIYKSDEFRSRIQKIMEEDSDNAFVGRIFAMYLGRAPDPQGLEHYLKLLESGRGRELVRLDVAKSKEAKKSYTFWHELDRLIIDHVDSYHPIKRWIGKRRREIRRKNREFEVLSVLLNPISNDEDVLELNISNPGSGTCYKKHSSLTNIRGDALELGSRKVLSRLQHASGISSPNRKY